VPQKLAHRRYIHARHNQVRSECVPEVVEREIHRETEKRFRMKSFFIVIAISLAIGFILGGYIGYTFKSHSDDKQAFNYFAEGRQYFDAQKYPEAAESFNRSIGLNPNLDSAHIMLSNAYDKMGLSELAKKERESSR
jgi:tetratricopeptide (TPR) repeat protein